MRQNMSGTLLSVAAVVTLAMSGCYEYEDAPAPAPAAAASAPDDGTSVAAADHPDGRSSARPSTGGRKGGGGRTGRESDAPEKQSENNRRARDADEDGDMEGIEHQVRDSEVSAAEMVRVRPGGRGNQSRPNGQRER